MPPAYLVVVLVSLLGLGDSATKTWIANTNFDNPKNWNFNRVPCHRDRVIISSQEGIAVYLSGDVAVRQVILPLNGELIFGSRAHIALDGTGSGPADSTCPGQDMEFTATEQRDWYDPANWNFSGLEYHYTRPGSRYSAVPHSERVPCQFDDVIFLRDTAFNVWLDSKVTVMVQSIQINGQNMESETIRQFAKTATGRNAFHLRGQIEVQNEQCKDPTGCACGNDRAEILNKICLHAAATCPKLECSDPVRPIGQCCLICGSSVIIDYGEGFRMDPLKTLFATFAEKAEYSSVSGYLFKAHDNKVQVIFVNVGNERQKAANLAQNFVRHLKQDMNGQKVYKIKNLVTQFSMQWEAGFMPGHEPHTRSGMDTTSVIGGVVAVVLGILFGVALAMMYYKKKRSPGFTFVRFDTDGSQVELELGGSIQGILDPAAVARGSTGFRNPMYDASEPTEPTYGTNEAERTMPATEDEPIMPSTDTTKTLLS